MPSGSAGCELQSLTRFLGSISYDRNLLAAVVNRCLTLWLWWTLAVIFGGMLSLIVWQTMTGFLGGRLEWRTLVDLSGGTLSLFVGFLPLFVVQRLVLHRHRLPVNSWVLRSSVGICLGAYVQRVAIFMVAIAPALPLEADSQALEVLFRAQVFWGKSAGLFVLWGFVGGAQWLVLRHCIRHAGWWVLASAVAGATSGAVALVVLFASGDLLLSYLARWLVYGALTGIALVQLLHSRIAHRARRRLERSALRGLPGRL
jgi:hypothetical protein